MKTYTALAASALLVAATMDSATAMQTYLKELPNGSSFTQELGHPGSDSSQFTKFGTAFGAVSHTWTPAFCKATFPGASMTNGEAFGDPCCTWTKGGKPDFTVTAFTTTPGKATVAGTPASGSSAETPSSGSSAETPSSGSSAETPSSGSSAETPASGSADTASSGDSPSQMTPTTDAPATSTGGSTSWGTPSTPSTGGGCAAKPARKFRH
ncbi:hypothetical protein PHYPSEUDO_001290 [Phytophthora pseudosyringae]|uniref:Temptin Cys/Cys disulfide domain-containing protein n=1 Tax=Phytophthora pseudosyringae TaxID=221518 RepID=A0A8T1V2B4_9STRA|nr:hypothetical protein PHYPSEUDO_001290 [Phytophthora pseudosyringae]